MKIYKVDFKPMWAVPSGCIIAANTIGEAEAIAKETITHTKEIKIEEVDISMPKVVFYESGDY